MENKSWKVETPWKKSEGTVTDKSGAKHTPMSRARDLARKALAAKQMKEEADQLEEGRGRPRKNPLPTKKAGSEDEGDDYGPDRGPEPDQNIHQQLKRAADTAHHEVKGKEGFKTKGGAHVKFGNGESHFVHAEHAKKVLSALDRLKPADRSKMHDHIYASHSNFQAVHKLVS